MSEKEVFFGFGAHSGIGEALELLLQAADRLDHYAHQLRRLHDNEFGDGWRHESRQDTGG